MYTILRMFALDTNIEVKMANGTKIVAVNKQVNSDYKIFKLYFKLFREFIFAKNSENYRISQFRCYNAVFSPI
jgi:hypothetical protein